MNDFENSVNCNYKGLAGEIDNTFNDDDVEVLMIMYVILYTDDITLLSW